MRHQGTGWNKRDRRSLLLGFTLAVWTALAAPGLAQVPDGAMPMEITDSEVEARRSLVTVPDGFAFELAANPPEVNYPTAITATPSGELFVAIDKNGSLGREPNMGSIVKVYDADGDGRGDHFTRFVESLDTPRGLIWDGEQLFVMHPPSLSVFRDTDGDGVADTSQLLVTGLGHGIEFYRGGDHTTNGIQMGIDGWIYISVGDFGVYAEGTDGSRVVLRTGGIVRVRPDGSELELYASGLRNPYDVAMTPRLDGFARGNTNDGYGWQVRLHHVVPRSEHGYPTLFQHFADEVKPPLADYDGGSGTGALFVNAPHLPGETGNALYSVDWGRSAVYIHQLAERGASFVPTQETFMQIPAPTDMTIDGPSNLYIASWSGGSFRYGGEDVGFIVRLTPEDADPEPVPDFGSADEDRLVEQLASPHSLYRFHAQRELLRRGSNADLAGALNDLARSDASIEGRVAAIFTLKELQGDAARSTLVEMAEIDEVREFALRALADRMAQNQGVPTELFVQSQHDENPRVRLQALNGLARLNAREHAGEIVMLTADPDRTVAHIAMQTAAKLGAAGPVIERLETGSPAVAEGATRVLQRMHTPEAVSGLIELYERSADPFVKRQALRGLARLYHRPAEWDGESWFGTTPSTRGPYFEPVVWSESDRIRPVLQDALRESHGYLYRQVVELIEKEGAILDGAGILLILAGSDETLRTDIVDTFVGRATVTTEMVPKLVELVDGSPMFKTSITDIVLNQPELPEGSAAMEGLLREVAVDTSMAMGRRSAALSHYGTLPLEATLDHQIDVHASFLDGRDLGRRLSGTIEDFMERPELAGYVDRFDEMAQTGSTAVRRLAYGVLLKLGASEEVDASARSAAGEAVSAGWDSAESAAPLLWAIGFTEAEGYEEQVRAHVGVAEADVAEAAQFAFEELDLEE